MGSAGVGVWADATPATVVESARIAAPSNRQRPCVPAICVDSPPVSALNLDAKYVGYATLTCRKYRRSRGGPRYSGRTTIQVTRRSESAAQAAWAPPLVKLPTPPAGCSSLPDAGMVAGARESSGLGAWHHVQPPLAGWPCRAPHEPAGGRHRQHALTLHPALRREPALGRGHVAPGSSFLQRPPLAALARLPRLRRGSPPAPP